ncbi:MAG: hypothetical protein O3C09_01995, partial [Proteobacteria bacterium]|nr:hypothetical protein [Pseudomonadota bacterium]
GRFSEGVLLRRLQVVPETRADPFSDQLHQPLVGGIQAPVGHEMLGELHRGHWPRRGSERAKYHSGNLALECRMTGRKGPWLDLG